MYCDVYALSNLPTLYMAFFLHYYYIAFFHNVNFHNRKGVHGFQWYTHRFFSGFSLGSVFAEKIEFS
jgi:hypothetical protein